MGSMVFKRQGAPLTPNDGNHDGHNGYGYNGVNDQVNWWWTPAGMATRYGICALLFLILLAFFVGGYYHARHRIRKGQQPLAYHRWMIRRAYPPPPPPRGGYAGYSQDPYNQNYGMDGYPPPPPAYNNAELPPPVYQPPQGASKAMADQSFGGTNRAGEGSRSAGVAATPAA